MAEALEIADTFDAIELRTAIESAFDISFTSQEAASISTMGDLHALLVGKMHGADGKACMHLMAFLRLRRVLLLTFPREALRVNTRLEKLAGRSPRKFMSSVADQTGLAMPGLDDGKLASLSHLLFALMLAVTITLALMQHHWVIVTLVPVVTFAVMGALNACDSRRLPECLATLGDLARAVSNLNPAKLAMQGGRLDSQAIWQALAEITQPYAPSSSSEVTRETKLAA